MFYPRAWRLKKDSKEQEADPEGLKNSSFLMFWYRGQKYSRSLKASKSLDNLKIEIRLNFTVRSYIYI